MLLFMIFHVWVGRYMAYNLKSFFSRWRKETALGFNPGWEPIDITSSPFKNQGLHCQVVIVFRGTQHNYRGVSFQRYGLKWKFYDGCCLTEAHLHNVNKNLRTLYWLCHWHIMIIQRPKLVLTFWVAQGHKLKWIHNFVFDKERKWDFMFMKSGGNINHDITYCSTYTSASNHLQQRRYTMNLGWRHVCFVTRMVTMIYRINGYTVHVHHLAAEMTPVTTPFRIRNTCSLL